MVYTASSAALAVLEVRVHLDLPLDLLPADYELLTIDLGDAAIEHLDTIPASPADFGDTWLREQRTPVLEVPSMIVAETSNLVINPAHPGAADIRTIQQRPFAFDRRLWL